MFVYRALSADDPKILEHLLAMTPEDRRCRFHGLTSDQRIRDYCAEMRKRDAHLIGCLEGERLVGMIEIVPNGAGAERRGEVGITVAADRRDHGIGHALVEHALDFAANHCLSLVFGYMPENIRIPRIVNALGGSVDRLEAEAKLAAPRPTAFSFCLEAIDDLGLFAADMLGFWRKALLTPLGAAAPPKPAPSEAD
jgi:GNAT superfamily N-acetyltransferase